MVPAETPVTIRVAEPIVATVVVLLVQVPPPASLNVVVVPAQIPVAPDIADGKGLTVATVVVIQPVPNV